MEKHKIFMEKHWPCISFLHQADTGIYGNAINKIKKSLIVWFTVFLFFSEISYCNFKLKWDT